MVNSFRENVMKDNEKLYCKMIGEAIRRLRIEKTGKSSLLFAYENDIPKSTLNRIERGENEAQIVTLKKIAEGFDWSLSELFANIENKLPQDFKIFDKDHY
jgi:transcriptional regulator with XRE-family HTH domain